MPKFAVVASAVTGDSRESWFGIHVIGRWTRRSLLDAAGRDICWLDSTSAAFFLLELAARTLPFSTESRFRPCCCTSGRAEQAVVAIRVPACDAVLHFIWLQAFMFQIIQSFRLPVFHLRFVIFARTYNQWEQFALLKSVLLCFNGCPSEARMLANRPVAMRIHGASAKWALVHHDVKPISFKAIIITIQCYAGPAGCL